MWPWLWRISKLKILYPLPLPLGVEKRLLIYNCVSNSIKRVPQIDDLGRRGPSQSKIKDFCQYFNGGHDVDIAINPDFDKIGIGSTAINNLYCQSADVDYCEGE